MDDSTLREAVRGELDTNETLLWCGQPAPGSLAIRALPVTLFGVFFFGFALFWMTMALKATRHAGAFSIFFPLFGTPFLLVGLAMLLAPLWAAMSAKKTIYAVTDQRAIIMGIGRARSAQSFRPEDLTGFSHFERADGSGDVMFSNRMMPSQRGTVSFVPIGFQGITNVRHVEQLMREHLVREAKPAA